MAAHGWSDGYVVDVEYTHGFYPELAPLNLAFVTALGGREPPDVDRPFAYLELGCGNGFTTSLLAAAHPHARFWANDFMPGHIRNARATAAAAGLENVTFLEASFAQLLGEQLPQFDMIALHGVWSWVSAENRGHIVALLQRQLKPGGLALVTYNCQPGWAPLEPLRRLLVSAAGQEGTPVERIERALAAAAQLQAAGAGYFKHNPKVTAAIAQLLKEDRAYLAHEYLNEQWSLHFHDDVARAVAPAGLEYVGQARVLDAFDQFNLTAAQAKLLAAQDAGAGSELLRDMMTDRRFRRDVYIRGERQLTPAQAAEWLERRRYALARPRAACQLKLETAAGAFSFSRPVFDSLLDALAQGPATARELASRPELSAESLDHVRQALGILVALGHVQPALARACEIEARAGTDRFNAAALTAAGSERPFVALASPVTGSGVPLPVAEQRILAELLGGGARASGAGNSGDDAAHQARRAAFHQKGLPALAGLGIV